MPKYRVKKLSEISKRHFYNLLKKERNILEKNYDSPISPSTSPSNSFLNYNFENSELINPADNLQTSSSCEDNSDYCSDAVGQFIDDDDTNQTLDLDDSLPHDTTSAASLNDTDLSVNTSIQNDSKSNCSVEYIQKLSNWATKYNIKGNSLNALLEIQRNEPGYSNLPKDCRTLLKTPRTTKIRNVEPGLYHHFGLNIALSLFVQSLNGHAPNYISVKVGIDGLPISKSSSSQIWPILCMFKSDKNMTYDTQVYPVGAYHGNEKPFCSNDFLKDFIEEVVPLIDEGFVDDISNTTIQIQVVAIICDAPAKSFVLKTKGHSGYYSCTKCTQKGASKHRRVYFQDLEAPLRTHHSFINQEQEQYHVGTTDLIELPNFDLVKCFPLDYMHLICLGVVKKLLTMWLFLKKGTRRLPHHIVESVSEKLVQLKDYTPSEFARKPRALMEANRWKATELRQFLLYTGPIVLKDKLDYPLYLNFMTLSVSLSIMLSQNYHKTYLNYADALLKWFVNNFAVVYGKMYISHNVHALIHLKSDVEKFGPLDECSAFPFENYMFAIKQLLTRKPDKPLQQFARRYAEQISTAGTEVNSSKAVLKENTYTVKNSHINGPVLDNNIFVLQYSYVTLPKFSLSVSSGNNCCQLYDNSIVVVYNIVKDLNSLYIVGKKFTEVRDFYLEPCPSSKFGVYFVENPSGVVQSLQSWDVKHISMKCLLYPYKNGFVIYPFLHS